jgi:hypothetical protein
MDPKPDPECEAYEHMLAVLAGKAQKGTPCLAELKCLLDAMVNPETVKPSNPQTLKPSNPQTLKPSNPQTPRSWSLNPQILKPSYPKILDCESQTLYYGTTRACRDKMAYLDPSPLNQPLPKIC